jgi:hypothetical protein
VSPMSTVWSAATDVPPSGHSPARTTLAQVEHPVHIRQRGKVEYS